MAVSLPITPPAEQHGQGIEIRVYNAAGKRRRLPSFQIGECNWTIEPQGGYSDFSLSIAARPNELTSIAAGDRLEIYKFGNRQYRGYVGEITRTAGDTPSLSLSGFGRILDLDRMVLDAVYQRSQSVDLSDLFAEVASSIQSRYPEIAITSETIGTEISTLDCRSISAKAALENLCNTAPSVCHFGFDVEPESGRDRLYLRKIDLSAADTTIVVPGNNVGAVESSQTVDEVINAVWIEGGNPKYPQLLPNGSFEVLSRYSSDDGSGAGTNLLQNPSFETSTSQNSTQGWTFNNGASAKKNGGQEASAYQGEWVVELDQNGEKISQTQQSPTVPLVAGRDYTFGIQSRPELFANLSTPPVATATVSWRNASGAFTVAGTFLVRSEVSAYRPYEGTFRCPSDATGFKFEIEKTSGSTGASKGILLDAAYVYDNSSLTASGWGIRKTGSAAVQAVNWSAAGAAHGKNALYLKCTSSDTDGQDIHVRLTPSYMIEVVGGQKFRFTFKFKGNGTAFTPLMQAQIAWYKEDGSRIGEIQRLLVPSQIASDWTYFPGQCQAPGDAVKAEAWIAIRGSGEIWLDALSFRDAAENEEAYLPAGNFLARFTATELVTSGENAEINGSITNYGLRERVISASNVDNFADARTVAKGYLMAHASGLPVPQVDLYDDKRPLWIGYTVRLSGSSGAAYSTRILPIMRLNGSISGNGLLTHNLELEKIRKTEAELDADLAAEKSRRSASTVAVNGASAASVPTGSSSGGGGSSTGVELPIGYPNETLVFDADSVLIRNAGLRTNGYSATIGYGSVSPYAHSDIHTAVWVNGGDVATGVGAQTTPDNESINLLANVFRHPGNEDAPDDYWEKYKDWLDAYRLELGGSPENQGLKLHKYPAGETTPEMLLEITGDKAQANVPVHSPQIITSQIGIGTDTPTSPLHIKSVGADLPIFETESGGSGFRTFDTFAPEGQKSWTVATDVDNAYMGFFTTNDAINALTGTPFAIFRDGRVLAQGTMQAGGGYLAADGTEGVSTTTGGATFKNGLYVGGAITGTGTAAAIASSTVSGTVKTDVDTTDPIVYLKTTTDTLLSGKAASSHNHSASNITSGTVATARLGSGTASSTTYLRGDQTYAALPLATTSGSGTVKINSTDANPVVYLKSEVDTALAGKAATSHTHSATAITSGTISTARLGSGTASSSTYLRGDNTWATISSGGSVPSGTNGQTLVYSGTTLTATSNLAYTANGLESAQKFTVRGEFDETDNLIDGAVQMGVGAGGANIKLSTSSYSGDISTGHRDYVLLTAPAGGHFRITRNYNSVDKYFLNYDDVDGYVISDFVWQFAGLKSSDGSTGVTGTVPASANLIVKNGLIVGYS